MTTALLERPTVTRTAPDRSLPDDLTLEGMGGRPDPDVRPVLEAVAGGETAVAAALAESMRASARTEGWTDLELASALLRDAAAAAELERDCDRLDRAAAALAGLCGEVGASFNDFSIDD